MADPREALLASATTLFAARGPRNVSVRELAADAGVNHGLVHYYFGSKDGLLRAVLDRCATAVAEELAANEEVHALYVPDGALERHARILAHVLLDARDPHEVQSDFPAVHALVERLVAAGFGRAEARRRAAEVTALVLGWALYGPFLAAATAAPDGAPTDVELRDAITALLAARPRNSGAERPRERLD